MKKILWTLGTVCIVFAAVFVFLVAKGANDIYWTSVANTDEKRRVIEPISRQQASEIAAHRWSVEQVLVNDPGFTCPSINCTGDRPSYSEIVFSALPQYGEPKYDRTIRIQRAGQPDFDKLFPGMFVEFNTTDNTCRDSNNLNVVCYLGIKKAEVTRNDIIGKWEITYEGAGGQ